MNAAERLMEYVKYETTSDENSGTHPSSPGQLVFAEHLADEMRRIGIRDVRLNRYGCLFGTIPATPGLDHLARSVFLHTWIPAARLPETT